MEKSFEWKLRTTCILLRESRFSSTTTRLRSHINSLFCPGHSFFCACRSHFQRDPQWAVTLKCCPWGVITIGLKVVIWKACSEAADVVDIAKHVSDAILEERGIGLCHTRPDLSLALPIWRLIHVSQQAGYDLKYTSSLMRTKRKFSSHMSWLNTAMHHPFYHFSCNV